MSFDETFGLTAGVHFVFNNNMIGCSSITVCVPRGLLTEHGNHYDKCPVECCTRCVTNPRFIANVGSK